MKRPREAYRAARVGGVEGQAAHLGGGFFDARLAPATMGEVDGPRGGEKTAIRGPVGAVLRGRLLAEERFQATAFLAALVALRVVLPLHKAVERPLHQRVRKTQHAQLRLQHGVDV